MECRVLLLFGFPSVEPFQELPGLRMLVGRTCENERRPAKHVLAILNEAQASLRTCGVADSSGQFEADASLVSGNLLSFDIC